MYVLLKMVVFHCWVSLPGGTFSKKKQKTGQPVRGHKIQRPFKTESSEKWWDFYWKVILQGTNMTGCKIHHVEDVFPIKKGDFHCHVKILGV